MKNLFKLQFLVAFVCLPALLLAQSIQSVSPNSSYRGDTLTLTILGSGTDFMQGTTTQVSAFLQQGTKTIYGMQGTATNDSSYSSLFWIPMNATLGLWDMVTVTWTQGTVTMNDAFTIKDRTTNNDQRVDKDVMFYPNPVHSKLYFNTSLRGKNFKLLNLDGKQLLAGQVESSFIELSDLKSGLYFLVIDDKLHKVFKD